MAKRFKGESTLGDNVSVVLLPFMTRDLNLKGNELMVYAIIYGFSQDGMTSFFGSRRYMADWIGASSLRTVDACIEKLVEKGLVVRDKVKRNGKMYTAYHAVLPVQGQGAKNAPKGAKNAPKGAKNAPKDIDIKQIRNTTLSVSVSEYGSKVENKQTNSVREKPSFPRPAKRKKVGYDEFVDMVREAESHRLENCTEEQCEALMEAILPAFVNTKRRQDFKSQKALCRKTVDELYGYAAKRFEYDGDIVLDAVGSLVRGKSITDKYLSYWFSDGAEGFKASMEHLAKYGKDMGWSKW